MVGSLPASAPKWLWANADAAARSAAGIVQYEYRPGRPEHRTAPPLIVPVLEPPLPSPLGTPLQYRLPPLSGPRSGAHPPIAHCQVPAPPGYQSLVPCPYSPAPRLSWPRLSFFSLPSSWSPSSFPLPSFSPPVHALSLFGLFNLLRSRPLNSTGIALLLCFALSCICVASRHLSPAPSTCVG